MYTDIHILETNDLKIVQELAFQIWPTAYGEILKKEQIEYMINKMYSLTSLEQQVQKGAAFYLLWENNIPIGFFSIENNNPVEKTLRLHKLYLHPNKQGNGYGKLMLQSIEKIGKEVGMEKINLNVNRFNNAVYVYQKQGYTIVLEEDVEIGNGYLMEDYQMEKSI